MGQALNKIFQMKYEMHAYGIDFEIENVFKKWNEKNRNSFWKLILELDRI